MNLKPVLFLFTCVLLLQACASGSRADFAIPGCEKAWVEIDKAKSLADLKTLVKNDCPIMYKQGWRIIDKRFSKRENLKPEACKQSFSGLEKAQQLDNVKFMITHNCPVFYRRGWIIPPN